MPAVILNAEEVGALFPIPKAVEPPFCVAKQEGDAVSVVEKFTVAIVPVVAPTAATIVRVPLVLLQE